MISDRLYFRQLLAGRDFGCGHVVASQMQNFVYLIGDRQLGQCVVVDPAWVVGDLVDLAGRDGMEIVGALATHYHPDHVGGSMFGFEVEGLARLQELAPCKVHVHRLEGDGVTRTPVAAHAQRREAGGDGSRRDHHDPMTVSA